MEFLGPSVSIETDVQAHRVSRTGRLLYSTGTGEQANRQLVWVTRNGEATPIDSTWMFTRGDTNVSWSLSSDGSRIVLREQTDGVYEIWVKQLDDGPRSRLTFDDAGDYFPQWTPDGEGITYVSGPGTALNVYTRRADGTGEPEVLLDSKSPSARRCRYNSGSSAPTFLVLRKNSESTRLSNRSSSPRTLGRLTVIVTGLIASCRRLPYPFRTEALLIVSSGKATSMSFFM